MIQAAKILEAGMATILLLSGAENSGDSGGQGSQGNYGGPSGPSGGPEDPLNPRDPDPDDVSGGVVRESIESDGEQMEIDEQESSTTSSSQGSTSVEPWEDEYIPSTVQSRIEDQVEEEVNSGLVNQDNYGARNDILHNVAQWAKWTAKKWGIEFSESKPRSKLDTSPVDEESDNADSSNDE